MNGYESAFKGAMHAYGILANKAVRMVKHVTGLAGDSVEHYLPTECEQCKEIAAFLDEWQDRAAELPLERNAQQGGQHLDSSYDEYEGTTFNPKKVSARPNREGVRSTSPSSTAPCI